MEHKLNCEIFADGADIQGIQDLVSNPLVTGFTTNPTLMKVAGVEDYLGFSKKVIEIVGDRPLSLEVFSDEFNEMYRQALILSRLGSSVFVKIPITNTRGESSLPLVKKLCAEDVQINLTALFTYEQIRDSVEVLRNGPDSFISVFAGRIADAGVDPVPTMKYAVKQIGNASNIRLIWASPREVLNVVQASEIGCHVITVTHDLLKKLTNLGKDLNEFSLDTVKMFANDAIAAGYKL